MTHSNLMEALQWAGFASLVLGTWFYTTRPRLACYYTILGCALLGAWALMLDPPGYGAFAVQFVVGALTLRNLYRWWQA